MMDVVLYGVALYMYRVFIRFEIIILVMYGVVLYMKRALAMMTGVMYGVVLYMKSVLI